MNYQPPSWTGYPPQSAGYHPQAVHPGPPPPHHHYPPRQYPYYPQQPPPPPPPSSPSFHITKTSLLNLQTNQQILTITPNKSALNTLLGVSSKPTLTISRPDTSILGTLTFHSLSTSTIDFTINFQSGVLKNEGLLVRDKWSFHTLSNQKWYWIMESNYKTGVLQDQKKDGGQIIARLEEGGMLIVERPGLSNAEFEEIFVTAVAMVEKGRRNRKEGKEAEGVAEVVSALAGG